MTDEIAVLYTEEQIARRVADLGQEIGRAFAGEDLASSASRRTASSSWPTSSAAIPLDLTMHLLRVTQPAATRRAA